MKAQTDLKPGQDILKVRQDAADQASSAAQKDHRWSGLATNTSDWAYELQSLQKMKPAADPSTLTNTNTAQLLAKMNTIKAALTTSCREVKAAGGIVDETLLNKF